MTTTLDLINDTKRYLLSSHREQLNTLSGSINSSVTSVVFSFTLGALTAGSVISVDLEIMYVWSTDEATKTAVVLRGHEGSAPASHSSGAVITVNPKFPDYSVFKALNSDITDISGDLFQIVTRTFTYVAGKDGYDLASTASADPLFKLDGKYDYPGIRRDWPSLREYDIRRNSNTTDFPSGFAITLKLPAFPGREVRITYGAAFGQLAALTDDVLTATGLPATAHDIPPLGAAIRLQGVREGQRNFNDSQPDTRRAAEVPAGSQIASIRAMVDFRKQRIMGEMKSLRQQYPYYRQFMDV